ncbi:MAG: hypothetical protein IPP41_04795 [Rhodocyclaceae bacterium]|nr:hypothetical protein [Rhodocyclaceae bacterium]
MALTTGGTMVISDVDSASTFTALTAVAGSNSYGTFSMSTAGVWTYTANSAHDEFMAGSTYTDSVSVTSADGTVSSITVNILGTNDAAIITPAVDNLTESNVALTTGGTMVISDVDSATTFTALTAVAGSNSYGTFSMSTAGVWTYTANSAHDEFMAGSTYTDSVSVTSADGTVSSITVNILGTNDAAIITPAVDNLTESNVALTTGGTMVISDVDSATTFTALTAVAGSNSYGTFSMSTAGVWTYTANSAHDEFMAGSTYTDSVSVTSADGTVSSITVNILGTNDAAVITPAVDNLTESNVALTTGGTMVISDVDSASTFTALTAVAGSNSYGTFSMSTAGVWTYTANSAHDEFMAGSTYTDSVSVTSADGTVSSITVNILGTNDAAVITPAVDNLTESNVALTTGGTMVISDVDSATTFTALTAVAGSNSYGTFSMSTAGVWTYTANSAHDEFMAGSTYTDSVSVTSADGTVSSITVNILGTNDAAVITPAVDNLTESNVALTTGGTMVISDVDSATTFTALTAVAGSNSYGTFSMSTAGVWTYTANSAHDEFMAGSTYTDSVSVTSADGTVSSITVNILGTNDAAVITPAVDNLTESNVALTTGGTMVISDVDSASTFTALTAVAGSNSYGTFSMSTAGVWTYTANSAHDEFMAGSTYTDSVSVTSADGTVSSITVNILGTNDAAVITPAVDNLTESNVALTTGGTMVISDVDSASTFTALTAVAGSNSYGTFSMSTAGVWTYTANSAHDEFMAGSTYTDSVSVTSADGTVSSITVEHPGHQRCRSDHPGSRQSD